MAASNGPQGNGVSGQDASSQLLAALNALMAQNKPQATLPNQAPIQTNAQSGTAAQAPQAAAAPQQATIKIPSPGDVVTSSILNQGQLIPVTAGSGGSSSGGGKDAINNVLKLVEQISGGSGGSSNSSSKSGSSSGGSGGAGGAIGNAIKAVTTIAAVAGWIICTELVVQNRMPKKYWIAGSKVFANYSEIGKRGYYIWAIPCVKHLRKHPNSLLSNFLCAIFNWRAENIAASVGVKGARKLLRGAIVTAILYPICWTIGHVMWVFNFDVDWQSVYNSEVK